jgi:hypothetical protein
MPDLKNKITTIIIIGLFVSLADWYIISGWQWVIEHKSCILNDVQTGKSISMICWDISPIPIYIITLIGIIGTIYYIIKSIEYIRS